MKHHKIQCFFGKQIRQTKPKIKIVQKTDEADIEGPEEDTLLQIDENESEAELAEELEDEINVLLDEFLMPHTGS